MKFQTVLVLLAGLGVAGEALAERLNGFDLAGARVPVDDILPGGPPRDGIPALDDPRFESAGAADWLDRDDRVLGIHLNGESKAYPIAILNWHEIVNDRLGGQPLVVTFCPLCGTGMVFDARVGGRTLDFGVSGLLYQSDVLLYDRQTESLWSQIRSDAVTGPMSGETLRTLAVSHTTWADWRERHPDTRVLSRDTGFQRDYQRDPYAGYPGNPATLFPVSNRAPGPWHAKEWVLGVAINGEHKAYPFAELERSGRERFTDEVGGESFEVVWQPQHRSAHIEQNGEPRVSLTAFWFAWYAFHPETSVFRAEAP